MNIEENVRVVKEKIRAAANGRDIVLVAATKMTDTETVRRAIAAGIDASGENRVQEMMEKLEQLPSTSTPAATRAIRTSTRPSWRPTWNLPERLPASCACAT